MLIKIDWGGETHQYMTNHDGKQKLANYVSELYVRGLLEPVKGAGDSQYAVGQEKEDISISGSRSDQVDLEDYIALQEIKRGI